MTIRSRLLLLLLPTLTALVGLIALFFYLNWSDDILNSFRTRLQSVVISTAQSINPKEIEWIGEHLDDLDLNSNARYQAYKQKLFRLKTQLPVDNLYIVRIEPVKDTDQLPLIESNNTLTKEHEGFGRDEAYRQVFLLDASHANEELTNAPGEIDFSETEEQKIYFTKKAFVTPIYESRKTGERFMSAYAPILDKDENVIALLGADVRMQEIDQKLQNALFIIFIGAFITILMVMATVFFIADRISKPVQQLNQAALNIAAGDYEADIQVEGPREIVELANTFNTMSECLVENISRLREGSLVRERMYGEYECALLLQHYMLQKVSENFRHQFLQMRLVSVNQTNLQKGLLLRIDKEESGDLRLVWIEALEQGFEALYQLNALSAVSLDKLKNHPFIECRFPSNVLSCEYRLQKLFSPLVWSIKSQQFIKENRQKVSLQNQDMIFLYNSSLIEQFETEEKIEKWFAKILRHFAEDGLDTIQVMLTNELNFLSKRENLTKNFQILSLQIKIPEHHS